jgi:hypothetical protein
MKNILISIENGTIDDDRVNLALGPTVTIHTLLLSLPVLLAGLFPFFHFTLRITI